MAALNPRITITVTPRVKATLDRFSTVTGKSKSSLVGEILDESVPMFVKMIKVMEAAKSMQKDLAVKVVEPFEDAQAHIEMQLGLTLADIDTTADTLLRNMESIGRRMRRKAGASREAAASGRAAQHSPLSNRGGRHTTDREAKNRKPLISKAKGKK